MVVTLAHNSVPDSSKQDFIAPAEATKLTVNQQHLKSAWDISQIATKDEWKDWIHRLSVEFMKESPSHALRACMSLVDIHPPLAKGLFNAAFISCWGELYDQYQARPFTIALTRFRLTRYLAGGPRSFTRIRDDFGRRTF